MLPFLGQDNNWDSCVITLLLTQHWIYFDFSSQVSFFNVQTNRKTQQKFLQINEIQVIAVQNQTVPFIVLFQKRYFLYI